MDAAGPVLELRMRRSWRILIGLAVPAFAILIVVASAAILSSGRGPAGGILGVAILVAVLGGLIVVPGTFILGRLARGVPDVRLDGRGIVWGSDRTRDLAIDWSEIESISGQVQKTQYLTDRLFVVKPKAEVTPEPPRTTYGRFMALANRMTSRSPYAISTMVADHPGDEIRSVLEVHLGRPIEETPAPGA
jgi:hypothetical protein